MRARFPFGAEDLAELADRLLEPAVRVVAMEDVYDGDKAPNVVAMRHDCDADHSLRTAVKMARWEHERGYRSTYYMLHTAPYWRYTWFPDALEEIAGYGHEIGIHADALAEAIVTGVDPDVILDRAIGRLRDLGHKIRGAAGHGNGLCLRYRQEDEAPFANDEQFAECRRPNHGPADRIIARGLRSIRLKPRPLADFGLEYEALRVAHPYSWRCADSGGVWLKPGFKETAERLARQTHVSALPMGTHDPRQLHLLVHPDWWREAFSETRVAA